MKKIILYAGVFVITALIGAFFILKGPVANAQPAQGEAPAMPVTVLDLKTQKIAITRSLPGRVSAFKQSQVRPQVDGIITERLFEEGANVEKGQQLYQIDDARYEAARASAEADLKSAKSTIRSIEARANRYKELVKIDAVSKQEYDDVKAELDQALAEVAVAEAAVQVAQVNLDYTKVYAPISGRIGRTLITEGALVTANQQQALAVITQLDPVYVDMQQASEGVMALQQARLEGQDSAQVSIKLGKDLSMTYPHKGILKFSEVTIDETTGSVTLRAVVPNSNDILMPGLFVRAMLELGEKDVLLVPQRATTRQPDGNLVVWVVGDDNTVHIRPIEASESYESNWVVTNGLTAGDTIVVEGYQKLSEGARVSPAPWKQVEKE